MILYRMVEEVLKTQLSLKLPTKPSLVARNRTVYGSIWTRTTTLNLKQLIFSLSTLRKQVYILLRGYDHVMALLVYVQLL